VKLIELENRLLSSIRTLDDLLFCSREGISNESFNCIDEVDHKAVWEYIEQSIRANGEVTDKDLISLHEFERTEQGDLKTYTQLVRNAEIESKTREVIASKIRQLSGSNALETVRELIVDLRGVQADSGRYITLVDKDAFDRLDYYAELQKLAASGDLGVKTGLKTFDNEHLGWRNGELVIVLGPTGCGKSWLSLYFAAVAYKDKKRVMVISPEMSKEETTFRFDPIYSSLLGGKTISNKALSTGQMDYEKYKNFLQKAYGDGRDDLSIIDSSGTNKQLSFDEIWGLAAEYKPDVLIVDGLHLIASSDKNDERKGGWEVLKHGVAYLKSLAQQQKIVVIAAHQPDRSAQKKGAGPAQLHQIAYGFSVAQSADRVLSMGFVEGQSKQRCFIVPKIRGGEEIFRERYLNFDVDMGNIWEEDSAEQRDDAFGDY
jgi:replicative DNA helicase